MVNKLKTLKEIECNNEHCGDECCWEDYSLKLQQSLKQEAIKWIKALEKDSMKVLESGALEVRGDVLKSLDWIKYFFNITEEELNDTLRGKNE